MRRKDSPGAHGRKVADRILRSGLRADESRDEAFRRVIISIPKGKVATYGQVAAAAGYPLYHRAVATALTGGGDRPASLAACGGRGGEIKLRFEAAAEQRLRLKMEGVAFRGKRVDLTLHQYAFRTWEL